MAAGLGFKDFVTGEVLTAADVDGYLMQGVWVFASAAARDAAVTAPQEGNFAYLKDTNVTTYYTGSAWANLDTTGMTNPMTTTGDTIYSSSGSTPARLGIGSTGNVLTVAGGVPTWAAPASGGGMTLLQSLSLTGSSVTSSTLSSAYKQFFVLIRMFYGSATTALNMRLNGDTGSNYSYNWWDGTTSIGGASVSAGAQIRVGTQTTDTATLKRFNGIITISRPSDTDVVYVSSDSNVYNTANYSGFVTGVYDNSAAITSITFFVGSGSMTAGTAEIYGVN